MNNSEKTITKPNVSSVPNALRIATSGALIKLTKLPMTLGNRQDCDIVLSDPYISQRHCKFESEVRGLIVTDLDSKNGTHVNSRRIHSAPLAAGQVIDVGRTKLVAVHLRPQPQTSLDKIVGDTAAIEKVRFDISHAATTDASVLILGPTGTGKELAAQAIHQLSPRCQGPYVPVNCGSIPEDLIASELFGSEKGAFTGATVARQGLFEAANGGSIFLDEIGELPRHLQPHLLRALECREIRRVGSHKPVPSDFRVIAATNTLYHDGDLRSLRLDLYHRLSTIVIEMPPLRDRVADIPRLIHHFASVIAKRDIRLPATVIEELCRHPWPGNVRELKAAVSRGLTRKPAGPWEASDFLLPSHLRPHDTQGTPRTIHEHIKRLMEQELERHNGNMRAAARALGMPKSTFADKAKRFGLRRVAGLTRR